MIVIMIMIIIIIKVMMSLSGVIIITIRGRATLAHSVRGAPADLDLDPDPSPESAPHSIRPDKADRIRRPARAAAKWPPRALIRTRIGAARSDSSANQFRPELHPLPATGASSRLRSLWVSRC